MIARAALLAVGLLVAQRAPAPVGSPPAQAALAQADAGFPRAPGARRQLHAGKLNFTLAPPDGWVEGTDKAALLVLEQPGDPRVRIAVRTLRKVDSSEPLESVIHSDIERFEAAHADASLTPLEPVQTRGDERAEVRRLQSASAPTYEEVAYLDSPVATVLLSLSAPGEKAFHAALPLFEKLVASYQRKEQ